MTRRQLLRLCAASLGGGGITAVGGGCTAPRRRAQVDREGRSLLRYMAWGNPEQLDVERQIIAAFEKRNPHARVQLFMVPGSTYADKLQLMLASRTAPDVVRVDHYIFPALARKEYFLPLDTFVQSETDKTGQDFLADFVPAAIEEGRWQNALYGMNVLFGAVMIYYNRSLFAQAGLPDPYDLDKQGKWDWATFTDFAARLTKREGDRPEGRALQFGTNMVGYPMNSSVVWNHGGDFINTNGTRMTLGEDPAAIKGIEEYANLRWKYRCAPTPADNSLSPFTFESGKIAMHWGWAGESPRFRKNISSFEWDLVPTPSGPGGNFSVIKGNQLCIYKESPNPELAWEFLKFMTGPETELLIGGELRRTVPTRFSVQRDPRYLKATLPPYHTDVFLEAVKRGRILPIDARYQEWVQEFNAATDGLFNVGSKTAAQACRDASARVNTILSGEEGF